MDSKKILKALGNAILCFAITVGLQYVRQVFIEHGQFVFSWVGPTITFVLVFVLILFGPDAAQRRQNRKDLADKFRK